MALDAALDVSSKPPVPPPSPPRMDSWARGGRRSKRRAGSPSASSGAGGPGADRSEEEYFAGLLLMISRGLRGGAAEEGGAVAAVANAKTTEAAKAGQQGYECSVCGKVYASYQALGGHKTSHRKPPTPPPAPTGDEANASGGGGAHAEEKEKVHQCLLCLRTFPSGQALGGHKRLHYEGGAAATDGVGVKDTKDPTKTKQQTSAAVMRDFDLNLPATTAAAAMGGEAETAPPVAKRARTMLLVA